MENNKQEEVTYSAFRKIFATVSADTFERFKRRCYLENVSLGQGLSALAEAYAHGAEIKISKKGQEEIKKNLNYIEEHKKEVGNGD
jgi:hypothetical protein